jgi:DNA-binding LytR/AlgR family response regulator
MEEMLASSGFFRIHRSYLINTSKIKKINTVEQSRLVFYFDGIDESIESSKDGAKLFRQKFGNHQNH